MNPLINRAPSLTNIGVPLANIFMEDYESKALASAPLLPKPYKRFVDDIGVL